MSSRKGQASEAVQLFHIEGEEREGVGGVPSPSSVWGSCASYVFGFGGGLGGGGCLLLFGKFFGVLDLGNSLHLS